MAQNNLVELIGNFGSDPTVHTDRNGREFFRFSLASTDSYRDENGEWKDLPSVWHTCFAFSENAKKYASFFRKGQRVKVTGSLAYRENRVEGLDYPVREAAINARKIEAAPLPKKGSKDNAAETGVEFSNEAHRNDEIPF